MRRSRLCRIKSLAVLFLAGVSFVCRAQIGEGWTPIHPNQSLQIRGAGAHHAAGGVEVFSITNAVRVGDQRAEQRIWNDYSSGTHQFEGYVKVVRLDGTFITLKQTFQSGTGAWFLCTVDPRANGTLRDHSRGTLLATNVFGRLVRINTIHDADAHLFYVYVDGQLRETRISEPGVAYNDKYGTYRAVSGGGPIVAEWSGIRLWTGGTTNASPVPAPSERQAATSPAATNSITAM